MEARKRWAIFLALSYPFTLVTIAAGFLAFVMIVLKLDLSMVSTLVLWFYFLGVTSIYLISKKALKAFGMRRYFLGFIILVGIFAVLSAAVFIHGQMGHP